MTTFIDDDGKVRKIFYLNDSNSFSRYDHQHDRREFDIPHAWYADFPMNNKVNLMEVVYICDRTTGEMFACRVIELCDRTPIKGPHFIARELRRWKPIAPDATV